MMRELFKKKTVLEQEAEYVRNTNTCATVRTPSSIKQTILQLKLNPNFVSTTHHQHS